VTESASLLEEFPLIASEAVGWDPSQVSSGSGKKMKWRCSLGHEFLSVVYNRTRKNHGCPFCSGRQLLLGFNDLQTKFPEVASQAYGWDPSKLAPASGKKMKWKCLLGHVWEERVGNRTVKGYGCPFCSNQRVWPGFNDLESKFPEVASQAYGWDPKLVAPFSGQTYEWKCSVGHIWKSKVVNRTSRGDGCSVCSNHQVEPGFNDLLTSNPALAKEAFGWNPSETSRASNKVKTWKCNFGHTYESAVSSRSQGSGCPYCAGKKVEPGFNDLKTKDSKLASEALEWDPNKYTKSSNKIMTWQCSLGHVWKARINARTQGTGCPYCAGKKVQKGFNDLMTTNPLLASESIGWDPSTVTANSHSKRKWMCDLQHVYEATVANRSRGTSCPYCSKQKVLAGFNDFATRYPDLVAYVDGWDPSNVVAGSNKKFMWRCELGHSYDSSIQDRVSSKGCPICLNKRVLSGFNDLLTKFPAISEQANGWDASKVLPGSEKRKSWKCSEGHVWTSPIYHRTSKNGTGCPTCAKTGFDPNDDGYLYFLRHESWEMLQIGITNVPDDRLRRHRRLGWEVLELRGPMDGLATQNLETSLLRMLRARGAKLSPKEVVGKFDGYSEAWIESTYPVVSLTSLIEDLRDFEKTKESKRS
jgi:hypothetical protein